VKPKARTKQILETKRLILEELDQGHFADLCQLLANVTVHKYFPKIFDEKESAEFLEKVRQKVREDGFSFWAVRRKQGTAFIGICGLLKQSVDNKEEIEVGYRINDF
jgi:ribosomal-protein-alanine N-acetyltransferase